MVAALWGCEAPITEPSNAVSENAVSAPHANNCLARIWQTQGNPDRVFDERHDELLGGRSSISCDGYTSPSALQHAIDRLKRAASARDADQVTQLVNIPFNYIDRDGRAERITSRRQFRRMFDAIFTDDTYAAIESLRLGDTLPNRSQGLSFKIGGLWFIVRNTGDEPVLVTVNHEALKVALRPAEQ
ncbi:MAG TPA: hypothetical protein VK614_00665 [Allosphingosinicella sp.]|nr:hypothetical protein [Allosphingosinicella sp.]